MSKLTFRTPLTKKQNSDLKGDLTDLISERLREIRRSKDMTQQELSEAAGLHLTYVGHLEAGKYHPSVFVLWKIARTLDVSLDDLVS